MDEHENPDETDKKLILLKKEIEIAKRSHQITKQRLNSKSQSLKKAKSTLTQTQKNLIKYYRQNLINLKVINWK